MEAMRDSGKPCVGHNLALDLAYSLHSFAAVRRKRRREFLPAENSARGLPAAGLCRPASAA